MTSLEDRLRAAARAAGGTVTPGSVPPLRLPGPGRRRLLPARPRGRHLRSWLPQLGAAAAVAAVVLGSLTAAHVIGGPAPAGHRRSARMPAPARVDGLPPYFIRRVSLGPPVTARATLAISSSATGRAVATAALPGQVGALAAGGGAGTFFADTLYQCRGTDRHSPLCRRFGRSSPVVTVFYRITLTAAGAQVRLLPIRPMPGPALGISATPDGRTLAIFWQGMTSAGQATAAMLTVASTATGQQHSWALSRPGASISLSLLSWLADGRRLAFTKVLAGRNPRPVVYLLDTGAPGASLLPGVALVPPARAGSLWDQLVSPDGSTVAGILRRGPGPGIPNGSVISFPAGTGQQARVLFRAGPDGHGTYWDCKPLWISHAGQRVLIRCGYHPAGGGSQHRVFLVGPGRAPRRLPWLEPVPVFAPGSMPES